MKTFISALLAALSLSIWVHARNAPSVVLGDTAESCDCPAKPTATAAPTEVPTPTPTVTPLTAIDEILALGYGAVWESPGILLITLSGETTNFDTNKDTLKEVARERLSKLAGILVRFPDNTLMVDGHTDNRGGLNYNTDLSRRRAQRVKTTLVEFGMEETRFESVQGWAFQKPIADNSTDLGKAQNRRVELRLKFTGYVVQDGQSSAFTPTVTHTPMPGDAPAENAVPLWQETAGTPTPLPSDATLVYTPTPGPSDAFVPKAGESPGPVLAPTAAPAEAPTPAAPESNVANPDATPAAIETVPKPDTNPGLEIK